VLKETYRNFCIGKHVCDTFPAPDGLKQGDALLPLLFNFASDTPLAVSKKPRTGVEINGIQQLLVCPNAINLLSKIHKKKATKDI
jgi:hypothetical protein